jgi:hypothetical protein
VNCACCPMVCGTTALPRQAGCRMEDISTRTLPARHGGGGTWVRRERLNGPLIDDAVEWHPPWNFAAPWLLQFRSSRLQWPRHHAAMSQYGVCRPASRNSLWRPGTHSTDCCIPGKPRSCPSVAPLYRVWRHGADTPGSSRTDNLPQTLHTTPISCKHCASSSRSNQLRQPVVQRLLLRRLRRPRQPRSQHRIRYRVSNLQRPHFDLDV